MRRLRCVGLACALVGCVDASEATGRSGATPRPADDPAPRSSARSEARPDVEARSIAGVATPASTTLDDDAAACRALDLRDWSEQLRGARAAAQARALLTSAGLLVDPQLLAASSAPCSVEVEVTPIELDGAPPLEDLVVARVREAGQDDSALAAAYRTDGEGRRCPVGAATLSEVRAPAPAEPLPDAPGFRPPAEYEAVTLLDPDRQVIAVRSGRGVDSSDPAVASYNLTYYALRDDSLQPVFGPFTLYESMTSSYLDDPTIRGAIELRGEPPRAIHTTTETDCRPLRASCRRNPDACRDLDVACKPGRAARSYRFVDGRYTASR
ncbi:MAG: hypothetical protein R3A51_13635 [Nannocystaceae bacterium]